MWGFGNNYGYHANLLVLKERKEQSVMRKGMKKPNQMEINGKDRRKTKKKLFHYMEKIMMWLGEKLIRNERDFLNKIE